MNDRIKRRISYNCIILVIVTLVITSFITPTTALIDLTGTYDETGGGGTFNFTGNFNQNLNTTANVTFHNVTTTGHFIGDGSLLTGLPVGFTYSSWFNQLLNTTNSPTFDDLHLSDDLFCDAAYLRAIVVDDFIIHTGDSDTFIRFDIDEMYFKIGGFKVLELLNSTSTFFNNVTIERNLTVDDNITGYNITSVGYFIGNGSLLTGISGGGSEFVYSDWLNQNLNSTDNVTFWNITATNRFIGDGSFLTNLPWFNPFNQDLNTTNTVTFDTIDTGQGANELYDMNQNVLTTSDVTFGNITATELYLTNATYTWNIYIDVNGTLVWEQD